jgi:hypothetical protein
VPDPHFEDWSSDDWLFMLIIIIFILGISYLIGAIYYRITTGEFPKLE